MATRIPARPVWALALGLCVGCSDFRDGPLVVMRADAGGVDVVTVVDHPPAADVPASDVHTCGDGVCASDENCASCPADCSRCPFGCGNAVCDGAEDCVTCRIDCGACLSTCGNSVCMGQETCRNCPGDCGPCPTVCGDGTCRGSENCAVCPMDCGMCPLRCGDGVCTAASESCTSCPSDCGMCLPRCGDGTCNGTETCQSCSDDCRRCTCAMGCSRNYLCNTAGMCALVPVSQWVVTITTGMISPTRADGSPWNGLTGDPNPYACLTIAGTRYCSPSVFQSRRPTWNFALPAITAQTLLGGARAEMIDQEFLTDVQICAPGMVTINADSFATGSVTIGCSAGQFTFTLRPM